MGSVTPCVPIGGKRKVQHWKKCEAASSLGWGSTIVYVLRGRMLVNIFQPGDFNCIKSAHIVISGQL